MSDPQTDPSISIRGVSHRYRAGVQALDEVDLEIGPGLFGLLGPNGAGKSTLMRIVCTLLDPSAGEVRVCGHDTRRQPSRVRAALGYLPQEFSAWRLQRVGEVLDMLARLSGLGDKAHREERLSTVLEQVGLTEARTRKVKQLSGGMVRRLGVAQALIHEPPVLVVDEPTVGLDPEERIRFRRLMAELSGERCILLSTHIVADLGSGCDDLAVIRSGKLVFRGSPGKLRAAAAGRVFEALIDGAQEADLAERFEISSRQLDNDKVRVRLVGSGEAVPAGADPVAEPTLEEAYLAFMSSQLEEEA